MKKIFLYIAIAALTALSACVTPKNITYMQGFEQGMTQQVREVSRIKVQPDDKLSIVVSAQDPELAQVFNLTISQLRAGSTSSGGSSGNQTAAFTVAPDGTIEYPLLGSLYVGGMEREQVAKMLQHQIASKGLLKDPIVIVEFLNAKVSVLGEVNAPGNVTIDRDNMTLLQALAAAGDLTITGERENVLVVREQDGQDIAYRVDLTNTAELMQSPAYYIQQNDVIYVEPNNTRKRQASANGNSMLTPGFWISIVSFISTLAVLIFK